jgi:hypothetical protein
LIACWYVGCSQRNASGAKYCSRCGRKLKAVERPTESSAACPRHLSEVVDDLFNGHFHVPRSWRRRGGP